MNSLKSRSTAHSCILDSSFPTTHRGSSRTVRSSSSTTINYWRSSRRQTWKANALNLIRGRPTADSSCPNVAVPLHWLTGDAAAGDGNVGGQDANVITTDGPTPKADANPDGPLDGKSDSPNDQQAAADTAPENDFGKSNDGGDNSDAIDPRSDGAAGSGGGGAGGNISEYLDSGTGGSGGNPGDTESGCDCKIVEAQPSYWFWGFLFLLLRRRSRLSRRHRV